MTGAVSALVSVTGGHGVGGATDACVAIGLDLASTAPIEARIGVEVDPLCDDGVRGELLQRGLRAALDVVEVAVGAVQQGKSMLDSETKYRRALCLKMAARRAERGGETLGGAALLASAKRIEDAADGIDIERFGEAMRLLPETTPLEDVATFARSLAAYVKGEAVTADV